jgi:5-methylcytosine-specific restriction protein B
MNKRIEVLYDREHTLGHAFFMPLKYEKDENKCFDLLQGIFSNKILPLLEEYFFEDWAKIRLVLGDENKATDYQFITENGKDYDAQALFGENVDLGYEIEERKSYIRNDAASAHPETYLGIYAN